MIRIKLEKNKRNEPIFKIGINDKDLEEYKFLKRGLLEGKSLKGRYNYQVPIRFFEPIIRNLDPENIALDKNSLLYFLEFSDDYDENYYYKTEADARYMKKWRDEGCPNIYKIMLDKDKCTISKEIAFKRIRNFIT
ncbi:hypothetical protein ACQPU1_08525 [Clostridium paraputrificum]|uniref:hypothetical protein n=1 Tax=Clostridium paraputrificum TaxID=29363 RepID=UPI003D34B101